MQRPIKFSLFLVLGTFAACSRAHDTGSAVQEAQRQPAGPVFNLKDALEGQTLLLQTKTHLVLSQADFLQLKPMLPEAMTALTEALVPLEKVAKVSVLDGGDLLRFTLTDDHLDITSDNGVTTRVAKNFAVKRVLPADSGYAFARLQVTGLTTDGQNVSYIYPLKSGEMQFGLDGAAEEKNVVLNGLTTLFANSDLANEISMPPAGSMLAGLFSVAYSIRQSNEDNVIHIKAKKLDQNGEPILDAQGRATPNTDYKFRKLLRDQLASAGLDAQLIGAIDRVTDVYVDRDGIKVWLSEAVALTNDEGVTTLGETFTVQSTSASAMVPVDGVTAMAYAADGAEVKVLRYSGSGEHGQIDVDVYGWKDTLLGTFGENKTVSFPF